MTRPPSEPSPLSRSLRADRTRRLRMVRGAAGAAPARPTITRTRPVRPDSAGAQPRRARARRAAGVVLRRTFEIAGGRSLVDRMAALQATLAEQREQIEALRAGWVDAELGRAREGHGWRDVEHNRVNLELLKGEVRELQHTLEELGMAFAPGTGLAGAAERFAELRENVTGLHRRLRDLSRQDTAGQVDQPDPSTPAQHGRTEHPDGPIGSDGSDGSDGSALFNYVGFERRFRGDPDVVNATLVERYADQLAAHQPVVDIGCGRAELLASLAERGVDVVGVEPDPDMAAEGRARGVTVHRALAGEYLRSAPDHSLGSIITTHVVEHLALDTLIEMLELAVRKLKPGGLFISETPNPASLVVLGNSYILDPTHVLPLHPSLLTFLCESAGFRDVRLRFYSPATDYHLPRLELPEDPPTWAASLTDQLNTTFDRLNQVLFGPQEYAAVATTPVSGSISEAAGPG